MSEARDGWPIRLARLGRRCLTPALGDDRAAEWITRLYAIGLLVVYSLKLQYSRAVLGMVWAVLAPVLFLAVYLPLLTYVFAVDTSVLDAGTYAFPCYVIAGFLAWNAFQEGLVNGSTSIVANPGVVKHSPTPVSLLPTVKVATGFVLFGVGTTTFVGIGAALGIWSGWALLGVLPAAGLLFLFTLGLALLSAAITVYVRDLTQILTTLLTVEFFACPLLYHPSMVPESYRIAVTLNPMTPFLTLIRGSLLPYVEVTALDVGMAVGWSVGAFLVGVLSFRRLESGFSDGV